MMLQLDFSLWKYSEKVRTGHVTTTIGVLSHLIRVYNHSSSIYKCENASSLHSIGSYVHVHAAGNISVFEEKGLRPFAAPGGAFADFDW